MKIETKTKAIEVTFPSGRKIEVNIYFEEKKVIWDTLGVNEFKTVLDIRTFASELSQIAQLVQDELNKVHEYEFNEELGVDTSDEFIIVNPPFKSEEDKMREVYFSFYDQMEEPERTVAKVNFDIAKCHASTPPKSILDAWYGGFPWGNGDAFDYCRSIAKKYRQEEPKSEEKTIIPKEGDKATFKERTEPLPIIYDNEPTPEETEEEKLRDIYFSFYDKMEEPERSQAKANWYYDWASTNVLPKDVNDALIFGFNWIKTKEHQDRYNYWDEIYKKYSNE